MRVRAEGGFRAFCGQGRFCPAQQTLMPHTATDRFPLGATGWERRIALFGLCTAVRSRLCQTVLRGQTGLMRVQQNLPASPDKDRNSSAALRQHFLEAAARIGLKGGNPSRLFAAVSTTVCSADRPTNVDVTHNIVLNVCAE